MTQPQRLDPQIERGLGDWLKTLRESSTMTQAELSQAAGVSQRNIQRWEAGQNAPGGYELLRLFAALGVEVSEMPEESRPSALNEEMRRLRNEIVHAARFKIEPEEMPVIDAISRGVPEAEIAKTLSMTRAQVRETFRHVAERARQELSPESLERELDRRTAADRLRALEAKVSELPTAEDLGRAVATLQAAIDRLANPGNHEAQQAKPAGKRGTAR